MIELISGSDQPPPITAAGWSSPVARQAHNLKVPGSNPGPATKPANKGIAGIDQCLGTGAYSYRDDWDNRDELAKVSDATRRGDILDIIVRTNLDPASDPLQ